MSKMPASSIPTRARRAPEHGRDDFEPARFDAPYTHSDPHDGAIRDHSSAFGEEDQLALRHREDRTGAEWSATRLDGWCPPNNNLRRMRFLTVS